MGALIVIAVIAGVGYFVSLRIHPLRRCPVCKMTGRHYGSVYSYGYRRCRACGGTGRKDRLGAKVFFGGTNNTGIYGPR
jgi:DnaJ-class molecular chaperone